MPGPFVFGACAFILTLTDQRSLLEFLRSNADVFAHDGKAFRCLQASMEWAKANRPALAVDPSTKDLARAARTLATLGPELAKTTDDQQINTIRNVR